MRTTAGIKKPFWGCLHSFFILLGVAYIVDSAVHQAPLWQYYPAVTVISLNILGISRCPESLRAAFWIEAVSYIILFAGGGVLLTLSLLEKPASRGWWVGLILMAGGAVAFVINLLIPRKKRNGQ